MNTSTQSLGHILQHTKGLTGDQVERALAYQQEHGVRFGDAAVAIGIAQPDDVVWALAQQFRYPYAPRSKQALHAELVVANDPFSEEVEAFRDLRSQLVLSTFNQTNPRQALAVVSSDTGDGKSFVAANLAVAFSQLPGRTLLIDANLRQPRLHQIFSVDRDEGLSGVLSGRTQPNVIKPVEHLPNLYLMPAGVPAPNPAELLQGPALSLCLSDLHARFEYVLVDTPASSLGSDARVIAAHCGAALMVGRQNQSRVPLMQSTLNLLQKSQVKMAGIVMNAF